MPVDPIREAVSMEWGGTRNLALRAALGLVEGEIGMVNSGDVVQVVVADHARSSMLARRLKGSLPAWTVQITTRSDGAYLVTAYEDEDALAESRQGIADLVRQLDGQ